jgi:hypothetical protein
MAVHAQTSTDMLQAVQFSMEALRKHSLEQAGMLWE